MPLRLMLRVCLMLVVAMAASACLPYDLIALSGDGVNGRAMNTPGGRQARNYIIDELQDFAEPIQAGVPGAAGYRQNFSEGTNVLGVIPGGDLADEYVVVGAHYDGTGNECVAVDAVDIICNGATDNAAGVSIVLEIGRRLAESGIPPRRTVVLAFWDGEEAGLLGSTYFVANPLVPLNSISTYVNYDIQGSNLLPTLRNTTFAVSAETGGEALSGHLEAATSNSTLDTRRLSALFGQLRSDYAAFLTAAVPTVFFTDSTGPCYNTTKDDLGAVDLEKLLRQAEIGVRITAELANADDQVEFSAGSPPASYDDAVTMAAVLDAAVDDLDRFSAAQQQVLLDFQSAVDSMVANGASRFSQRDITALLGGSANVIQIVSAGECGHFRAGG